MTKTSKFEQSTYSLNVIKSKYLDQDAGDGLQSKHYHCVDIHQSAAQFDYILHEVGNRARGRRWTLTSLSGMS